MFHKIRFSHSALKKIVYLSAILATVSVLTYLTVRLAPLFYQAARQENSAAVQEYIRGMGPGGLVGLLLIQILQVIVALLPGEPIEVIAGMLYGVWGGLILCLTGILIGSLLIFAAVRKVGAPIVHFFVGERDLKKLKILENVQRLDMLIFLLFFIPGTPKDLLTYFVGLTPVRLRTFLLISTIARLPSVVSSTVGGHALGTQQYILAIIVFLVTGVLSLCGMILYQKWMKHKSKA